MVLINHTIFSRAIFFKDVNFPCILNIFNNNIIFFNIRYTQNEPLLLKNSRIRRMKFFTFAKIFTHIMRPGEKIRKAQTNSARIYDARQRYKTKFTRVPYMHDPQYEAPTRFLHSIYFFYDAEKGHCADRINLGGRVNTENERLLNRDLSTELNA